MELNRSYRSLVTAQDLPGEVLEQVLARVPFRERCSGTPSLCACMLCSAESIHEWCPIRLQTSFLIFVLCRLAGSGLRVYAVPGTSTCRNAACCSGRQDWQKPLAYAACHRCQ